MDYAKVAVNLPLKNLFRQFTYKVPPSLDFIGEGWRVVVPFGRQLLEGFIVEADEAPDASLAIKSIVDVVGTEPWFDEEMLGTAHWIAQYYLCPLAEALRLFIPGKKSIAAVGRYYAEPGAEGLLSERERSLYTYLAQEGAMTRREIARLEGGEGALKGLITKKAVSLTYEVTYKLKEKFERTVALSTDGLAQKEAGILRGKGQLLVLSLLQGTNPLPVRVLEDRGVSAGVIRNLVSKGILTEGKQRVLRDSYHADAAPRDEMILTDEQQAAINAVEICRKRGTFHTFLLRGVTGSGKTEVYLRLTDKALRDGKQVMVLVPEIALTDQIVKRFKSWFGNAVAVAHSKLSASERADVWDRMRNGKARVLIGVRSAVFCPFKDLGLVVIDEEHESTYKQEERPGYNARLVAQVRANAHGAPVVLGSATPDLETY